MGVKNLYTFFTLYFIQATIRGSNTLKRHKKPISFPSSAARHSWATLPAFFVPRQCGATPLGDIISLFRSTTARRDTLGRHYLPFSFPAVMCGTLGRHYLPFSFHDSAARHPWATLPAFFVPRQCGAAPLGDIISLSRSTTVRRDTLGRHYQPLSFHDSAARHPWATLPAFFVPRQRGATPLSDIISLFRSTTARRDTLERHYQPFSFPAVMCGTLERHYQPLSFHDSAAQHS